MPSVSRRYGASGARFERPSGPADVELSAPVILMVSGGADSTALLVLAATSALDTAGLAVAAIDAGVDMVLMPADLVAAHQGVVDAVGSGELTEARIDESVTRILRVKLGRLG